MGKENSKYSINNTPDTPFVYLRKVMGLLPLAASLAKGEIMGRNAQTWLGHLLSLLQILISMLLYWFIFGVIIGIDTGGIPYPVFLLTGIVPWAYFSGLVQESGNSLINSWHLINKVYFPRVILPASKTLTSLIDFFIALALTLIIMIIWKTPPGLTIVFFPLFLIVLMFSGLAIGLWLSSISVKFRDLTRLVPHLINFGFFITPVFYPSTIIPQHLGFLLYFNPAAFAIEGFRWSLFGGGMPSLYYLVSLIPVSILWIWGWHNYRKNEKYYADII